METPQVVAALLEKRTEIGREIADLERQVRKHEGEIERLDATIRLFSPDLGQARASVTRFARSAYFVTGDLTRDTAEPALSLTVAHTKHVGQGQVLGG